MTARSWAAGILFTLVAGPLAAQEPPIKEEHPGLLARATIPADTARAVARRTVPGGRIKAAEIETEDGKLVYSFDLVVAGKTGVEEVLVDAMTGKVVSVEHEEN